MTMSSCTFEPVETVQSPGDDTHAAVTRLKEHQSTDCAMCVVHGVGGWRAWPSDACSHKDAGKRKRKTPTPCENEQAQNSKKKGRYSRTKRQQSPELNN